MPKKTEKPKKKPDKKLSQKEKFIEYAKEIGVDEDADGFERAFDKITENSRKMIP